MADEGRPKEGRNRPRSTGNLTSPRRILAQERVNKALELRKAGVAYRVIAERCGYKTAQHAHKAVKAAILALPRDNAEETKAFEMERLDRLMLTHWERAIKGDIESGRYILTLMQRRAAMCGLDAPTLVNQTNETVLKWEDSESEPRDKTDATDADADPDETRDPDAPPPPGPAGG